MPAEFVEHNGERFYIQSTGRYFQSGRKGGERLLHRRIWIENYGPIPDGMAVHHKNGNWRNNDPDNLELVDPSDHQRAHMGERWGDVEQAQRFMVGLERARAAAPAWHGSDEGRRWHTEHGRKCWVGREPLTATCVICESVFPTFFPTKARTCSKKCRYRLNYKPKRRPRVPTFAD